MLHPKQSKLFSINFAQLTPFCMYGITINLRIRHRALYDYI